ncbi:unnamed protein product, partial [Adineta steineri]
SSFQKTIKTLRGTSTTIISQLSNDNKNCSSYYLLHPYLVLLPGVETTFLPVRILKSIYSSKTKIKTNQSTNIEVLLFNNVQRVQSGRWSMEQAIYDKLNIQTDLPNVDHKTYLNTIRKDYCMKRVWTDSPITKDISHLLPSPNQILNNQLNSISNHDLIESIKPFNELVVYYAQMATKDLDLDQQHHPLLNACRSLASALHLEQVVTWHSTHIRLIQLIERFPRLKPFLIILNKHGLHLKGANKIQQVFHSICQYLQLQYEQQTKDDNSFENYRLRIFWLTDSHCSDVLSILDLFLNLSQQTGLLIDLHYADSDSVQLANAQQTFNTHITNQTIDLYDSKTLEKISFESFDIIFSANQLLGNQDLRNC